MVNSMDDHSKIVQLEEIVRSLKDSLCELKAEIATANKDSVELKVRSDQLERRLVQHNARHETNYKELCSEFKSLKEELYNLKSDVISRLDSMSGRDSVLKFFFGAAATAIVLGIMNRFLALI